MAQLLLTRGQILGHRRRVNALDGRLPAGQASLEQAAWAGLQDSAARAAVLSLYARVTGTMPDSWADPALIQVWGLRFAVYVVAARDRALFTLGRYPEDAHGRHVAEDVAARISAHFGQRRLQTDDAAAVVPGDPNRMRYGATTGTIAIRWNGARQPDLWIVPRPDMTPHDARLELARRHLHMFGPATGAGFAKWAGIKPPRGPAAFDELGAAGELLPVRTPIGDAHILASDETSLRSAPGRPAVARILPSGDNFFLLWGADRELLIADPEKRRLLWTGSVPPGALLVNGEIVGTWRRDQHRFSANTWRRLTRAEVAAVEQEALSLPLPGLVKPVAVTWEPPLT